MDPRTVMLTLAAVMPLTVPAAASAAILHTVAPGESLTSIAMTDGLSVPRLAAANGLAPTAELIAGSQLRIPAQRATRMRPGSPPANREGQGDGDSDDPATGAVPTSAVAAPTRYLVRPGDTLSAIADRAGTTVSRLAALNALNPNGVLLAGTTLTLRGARRRTQMQLTRDTASPAVSQPVGQAAEGAPNAPPYPTPQVLSPYQVASIAAAYGVPGPLADAIAYQESGFNNDLVSSSDARGVMQITPGTWAWIQRELAGTTPLAPASAPDNVRAGVLLIASLLRATGGNRALAVAGYFQGLPSVLRYGMEPPTRQYVADVLALQQRFGGG